MSDLMFVIQSDCGYLRIRTDEASRAKNLAGYWTWDVTEATQFSRTDADSLSAAGWGTSMKAEALLVVAVKARAATPGKEG